MSDPDLPPLDAEMRTLLEGARAIAPAPAGIEARVLARVEGIVLPPLPGGGGGGGPGSGGAAATGNAASVASSSVGALRRLLPLAAAFAVGGGAGAGAMRVAERSPAPVVIATPPRIVYVDRPGPTASVADVSSAPAPASAAAAHPSAAPSVGAENGLAAERVLLDVARGEIERQNGAAALAATREHERRFPNGLLVQEREAMAVRALVLLGRRDEARARTDRFRAHYPGSVLTQALEAQTAAPAPSP